MRDALKTTVIAPDKQHSTFLASAIITGSIVVLYLLLILLLNWLA